MMMVILGLRRNALDNLRPLTAGSLSSRISSILQLLIGEAKAPYASSSRIQESTQSNAQLDEIQQLIPPEPYYGDMHPKSLGSSWRHGFELRPPILEKIRECKTFEEIEVVAKDLEQPFGLSEVVVLMSSMKKLPQHPPREFVDKVAAAAIQQCFLAQPKDISNLMHACAKMGYINQELLTSLAEQAMLPFQIEAFEHSHTALCLFSLGLLHKSHNQAIRRELLRSQSSSDAGSSSPLLDFTPRPLFLNQDELVYRLVQRFVSIAEDDHINSWHASNAIFGIAQLGLKDERLFKKLGDVVTRANIKLDYTEQGLMGVFQGLRQMKFSDEEVLGELAQVMPAHLERFSEPDLVAVLQGLAEGGVRDKSQLNPLVAEITKPTRIFKMGNQGLSCVWTALSSLSYSNTDQLMALSKECSLERRLSEYSLKSLYHILSSMQRLQFRDMDFLRLFIQEILKPKRVSGIQERDIATYIYSMGQLQFDDADAILLLLEEAFREERMQKYDERGLSSMLFALSKWGNRTQKLLGPVLEELSRKERLENFSSLTLSSIMNGLGRLNPSRCLAILKIIQEAVKPERLSQYTELGLAHLVSGLGKMGHKDDDILRLIVKAATHPDRLAEHTPRTLGIIMNGLKDLEFSDMELIEPLVRLGCSQPMLSEMTETGLSVLLMSLGGLRYRKPEYIGQLLEEILKPERLRGLSEYSLSRIMLALGQLKQIDGGQLQQFSKEITKPGRIEKFHVAGLAGCLYAFGQLSVKCSECPEIEEFVRMLGTEEKLKSLGCYDLARAIHGVCHIQYRGPEMNLYLSEAFSPERLERVSVQDMSMICFSVGYLGYKSLKNVQSVMNEISDGDRLMNLGERGLASLTYGLGQMTPSKVPECGQKLLMELVNRDTEVFSRLSCMDISGMLYGLGQLGLMNQRPLIGLMEEAMKPERIQEYTPYGIANIVYCLGQLKFRNLQIVEPIMVEAMTPERYMQYTNHGLVGTLFSLSQLGVNGNGSIRTMYEEAMKSERLEHFTDGDLSMLMYSLAQMKPMDSSYFNSVVKRIVSEDRLCRLEERGLCALLNGMVQARVCNAEAVDAVLAEVTKPKRLSSLSERAISSVMYNLSHLGYAGRPDIEVLGNELLQPDRLHALTLSGLANSIHAIGKLKYDNPKLLKSLVDELVVSDPVLNLRETMLSNIMYGLGVHKFYHPTFMELMETVVTDPTRLSKFSDRGLLTLIFTYDALGAGSEAMVSTISKVVFGNKERLSALSDEQLATLMNVLGVIKRRAGSRYQRKPSHGGEW